ncbi:MAG TPA: hypothetical protein QF665_04510 [Alphaproteobacteria bacterium]|jgi:hypothetical protein|nr:hypothetical protein [Alphaproteobacteria bacterium]
MVKVAKCLLFLAGWALAATVSATPATAATNGPVGLVLEAKAGFTRLSFPWRRIVDYRVRQTGNVVSIMFLSSRSIAGDGLARRESKLIRWAAGHLLKDGSEFTLVLAPKARVRYFRIGPEIVMDILAPPGPAVIRQATVRFDFERSIEPPRLAAR